MKKLLLLLLMISCATKEATTPKWFMEGKENTEEHLYGYGSGNTKASAEYVALSNLKERIHTSVSSQTFMQDILTNNQVANEYSRTVKTKMPTINIPHYDTTQVDSYKNETFVEVEVSRQKLADSVFNSIQKNHEKLTPLLQEYLATGNNIRKVALITKLKNECDSHIELERFYNGLGYVVPNRICPQIIKVHHNFKLENTISIAHTNPIIEETLINVFANKFTILINSPNVISYKTSVKTKKVGGSFMSGVEITIMQSNSSEVHKKNCVGSSSESKEKATENAFNACLAESKSAIFEEFFNIK